MPGAHASSVLKISSVSNIGGGLRISWPSVRYGVKDACEAGARSAYATGARRCYVLKGQRHTSPGQSDSESAAPGYAPTPSIFFCPLALPKAESPVAEQPV